MITAKLKAILLASGCSRVIYEQNQIANLRTDVADQTDIIAVLFQLNDISLEARANAIMEHYPDLEIDIIQMTELEGEADDDEVRMQALLDICKEVIIRLIAAGEYKTIMPVRVRKVLQTKYDINAIGWTLPLDLTYLLNEIRDPCL